MAREGIPSAVLLDALGTLVELEPPVAAPRRTSWRRAASWSARGRRARGDAGRDRLLPRPPRRGARRGRRWRTCAGAAPAVRAGARWAPRCRWPTSRTRCWRRCASAPTPRCPPCSRACARAARAWPWSRNWDVSLHDVLERTGLRAAASTPSSSRPSSARQARPGDLPRRARARWAPRAAEAMHVGDSVEPDVAGARAAGLRGGARRPRRRARRPPACASSRRSTGCSMT